VALSKCDEKIARFEELLQQMRTDLYGSLEAISDKISQSAVKVPDPPKKKGVPRIIGNVQLVPPRSAPQRDESRREDLDFNSDGEGWTEVHNRKSKRKLVKIDTPDTEPMEVATPAVNETRAIKRSPFVVSPGTRRRAPRAAAVSIKAKAEGISYADREGVNLKDLGIINPKMRRAANGGVIIEIAGPEGAIKADTLASRLREIIGENAAVSRPVVKADIRLSGFDDSVIKDEIITIVTEYGNCLASDVRVGQFRPMRNGLNMVWLQCPLSAAIKLSKKSRINIGWSVARVEMMRSRPVQCFKCWHFGHVR